MICLNNNLGLLNEVVAETITEIIPAVQERDFVFDDFVKCYEKYVLPKTETPIKNYIDVLKVVYCVYFTTTNKGIVLLSTNNKNNVKGFIDTVEYLGAYLSNLQNEYVTVKRYYRHKHIEWEYYFDYYKSEGLHGVVQYMRDNSYTKYLGNREFDKPYLYYPDFGNEFTKLYSYGEKIDLIQHLIKEQYYKWKDELLNNKKHKFIAVSQFDEIAIRERYAETYDIIKEMCLIIDINKPITAVDVNKLNLTNKEVRK
jgi:hypothetical protein